MSIEGESPASNLKSECSKKPRKRNQRSIVWKHFTKYHDEDGKERARCNYCVTNYVYDSKDGTTNMRNHITKCKGNPANSSDNRLHLTFSIEKGEETGDSKVCLQPYRFDGLKEVGNSVDHIRALVRWVRQSPARLKKFKEFTLLEGIDCQKSLPLDVATRWNSTYLMLSVASEYERAFDRFIEEDLVLFHDLQEGPGVPDSIDWENVKSVGGFLRHFYELTLRVSGIKYITSNTYLDSISCIDTVLKQCLLSDDEDLKTMAESMTFKFNKYWGDIKKFNLLVFIASLFDLRTKLAYLKVNLRGMYGVELGDKVGQLCEEALVNIFNEYKRIHSDNYTTKASSSSSKQVNEGTSSNKTFNLFGSVDDTFRALRERNMAEVKRQKIESGVSEDSKTELYRYLKDEIEGDNAWFESEDFTVLGWWKKRSPAFSVLSLVARDILAIPISIVASESAFSTGGRVLYSFRSSLTPQIVEALICCQDWTRSSGVPLNVEENIDDLDKFEEEMKNLSIE